MTQLMINKQSGYVGALTSIILILGHDSSPQMAEYNEDFTTRFLLGSHVTHTFIPPPSPCRHSYLYYIYFMQQQCKVSIKIKSVYSMPLFPSIYTFFTFISMKFECVPCILTRGQDKSSKVKYCWFPCKVRSVTVLTLNSPKLLSNIAKKKKHLIRLLIGLVSYSGLGK